jgi:hypothetical protein
MTGVDNPSIGEMIAEELRKRLIELEAEVQVGFAGAQDRLDAVRSLLNLWNSFAFEHIVKRPDLVPPAAFELHSSRSKTAIGRSSAHHSVRMSSTSLSNRGPTPAPCCSSISMTSSCSSLRRPCGTTSQTARSAMCLASLRSIRSATISYSSGNAQRRP